MIRVIASDMDGTLLDESHQITERTVKAIKAAQAAGIRFIVTTGRGFEQALHVLKDTGLECDYIVHTGAQIFNSKLELLQSGFMNIEDCRMVYNILKEYDLTYLFCTEEADYCVGSTKNREQELITHILTFNPNLTEAEIREGDMFKFFLSKTKVVSDLEELVEAGVDIIKIYASSNDLEMIKEIEERVQVNTNLAVASSFENNIEITDIKAQKGSALKSYIESLGYTMDEVMVLGDSMNDYSMLCMDFGATVAMENGVDEIKKVAKYITKSNDEDGAAYCMEELLKKQVDLQTGME